MGEKPLGRRLESSQFNWLSRPTCPSPASPPAAPLPPLPSPYYPPPRHSAPAPAATWTARGRVDRAREFHPACAPGRSHRPSAGARDNGGPPALPATPSEKSSNPRREIRRSRYLALPSPPRRAAPPASAPPPARGAPPKPPRSSTPPAIPPACGSPSSRPHGPERSAAFRPPRASRYACRNPAFRGLHHDQTKFLFATPSEQTPGTSHPCRCTRTPSAPPPAAPACSSPNPPVRQSQ